MHSRFDDRADPLMDAPIRCLDAALQMPHIDLRLYNHTDNGVSGFHYDPVFLRRVRPRGCEVAPETKTKRNKQ